MGRGGQIQQLLSDLPIDEKWVLIGLAILAAAAISHLYGMWREARFGMDGADKSPHSHPADRYFQAWQIAGEDAGLQAAPVEGALKAPRLGGALRGLRTGLEMHLERSGRRNPDPEAINPATARCCVTARIELPSPWREATVRQFIRPKAVNSSSTDDVTLGDTLPEGARPAGVRLSRRSRRAITAMVDEFDTVKVVGGTLTIADCLQPSRNTAEWKGMFADWIRALRRQAKAFADGALTVRVELPSEDDELVLRLDGGAGDSRAIDELRERIQQAKLPG